MTTLKLRGFRRSYSMCQHHTTSVFAGAAAAANRPPQRSNAPTQTASATIARVRWSSRRA